MQGPSCQSNDGSQPPWDTKHGQCGNIVSWNRGLDFGGKRLLPECSILIDGESAAIEVPSGLRASKAYHDDEGQIPKFQYQAPDDGALRFEREY